LRLQGGENSDHRHDPQMNCLRLFSPTYSAWNHFPHIWHLIQTHVLTGWAHFTPQNPQGGFSSSSESSFSSTSELKSSTKNPAPFRHVLSVSLVWFLFSFHFESPFLRNVLSILLSSQEMACCCLLRRVCVLSNIVLGMELFQILRQ
jgi:hypothetical protein